MKKKEKVFMSCTSSRKIKLELHYIVGVRRNSYKMALDFENGTWYNFKHSKIIDNVDNGIYISGLTALDDAIVASKAEKPTGHTYVYTGETHNKVPSVSLDVGPMYFSVVTEDDFNVAFNRIQRGRVRWNLMSLVPIVEYFRGFCRRDAHSVI